MDPHPFRTRRLHMRPLGTADEALYCRLYTDPDVMRQIAAPLPLDTAQRNFRAACRSAGDTAAAMQVWVIAERDAAAAVGILARIRHAADPGALELGAMLLGAGQGRGFAAEALAALADRTFETWPGCLLWTRHAPANIAAAALMHRLGFLRADVEGAGATHWRWQMTGAQWQAARRTVAAARVSG